MDERFDNIYRVLQETVWWLDRATSHPLIQENGSIHSLRDIRSWLETEIDTESDAFLSYVSRYNTVLSILSDVIRLGQDATVYDTNIPEEYDEYEMMQELLGDLNSQRFFIHPTIANLLLSHHALVRTAGYLEMKSDRNGLCFHLYNTATNGLRLPTYAFLLNTHNLLSSAYSGDYIAYAHHLLVEFSRFRTLSTCWIKNKAEKDEAIEVLNAGMKYADLAYGQPQDLNGAAEILHPYIIKYRHIKGAQSSNGFFHLQRNMNGFIAYTDAPNPKIILSFAGTEPTSWRNWKTDIGQYFCGPNLPYLYAYGILRSILLGKSHRNGFKDAMVEVYGHSLGGGMMQFAVANQTSGNVSGFGYNSAGLGIQTIEQMESWNVGKILHLYQPEDVVFRIPYSYQLGRAVRVKGLPIPEPTTAHLMATLKLRRGVHNGEKAWILG